PTFVPLDPGVRPVAAERDARYQAVACKVGCDVGAAVAPSSPNPPTNLAGSLAGNTLTLTWTAPAADDTHLAATSYMVELGTTSGGTQIVNIETAGAGTTFQWPVPSGTTVYGRVRGNNSSGVGDPSNE